MMLGFEDSSFCVSAGQNYQKFSRAMALAVGAGKSTASSASDTCGAHAGSRNLARAPGGFCRRWRCLQLLPSSWGSSFGLEV